MDRRGFFGAVGSVVAAGAVAERVSAAPAASTVFYRIRLMADAPDGTSEEIDSVLEEHPPDWQPYQTRSHTFRAQQSCYVGFDTLPSPRSGYFVIPFEVDGPPQLHGAAPHQYFVVTYRSAVERWPRGLTRLRELR